MTRPNEIAELISSFTARLEKTIDLIVAERLDAAFRQIVPAAPTPRAAPAAPRRPGRPAASAAKAPAPIVTLPKGKAATVIPANIPITRLPPGRAPKQQRYSELRSQCRVPGCPTKNSGPRFDFFCREHYARLNREEREKMKVLWKQGVEGKLTGSAAEKAASAPAT